MTQRLQLPDGRTMEYAILGGQGALPLIFLHGTPGSWIPAPGLEATCKQKGIPLITFCRAGYGDSSRQAGRRVVDAVKDVQALLDHLGYKKCIVGGWSGGGPHALACAARLPACAAVVALATVAPYDAEGLDWLAGQGQDNVEETQMSQKGEQVLREYLRPQYDEMLKATTAETLQILSSIFPDVDKKCLLENEEMAEFWEKGLQQALKKGIDGVVDDDLAFIEPWGFDLAEIKRPVLVYHGNLDLMCPYAHGHWVADHIPAQHVTRNLKEGQGHLSIWLGKEGEMLDTLVSLANKTTTC